MTDLDALDDELSKKYAKERSICINCENFTNYYTVRKFSDPTQCTHGECRLNPPTFSTLNQISCFPLVRYEDWCSQFENKYYA